MRWNLRAPASLLMAATLIASLQSCNKDEGPPEVLPGDLYGLWFDLEGTTLRVFEFRQSDLLYADLAGLTDVFFIYMYEQGEDPIQVQRGRYEITGANLVTHVTAATDTGLVGGIFANEILDYEQDLLTIESTTAPDGRRSFERTDAYP